MTDIPANRQNDLLMAGGFVYLPYPIVRRFRFHISFKLAAQGILTCCTIRTLAYLCTPTSVNCLSWRPYRPLVTSTTANRQNAVFIKNKSVGATALRLPQHCYHITDICLLSINTSLFRTVSAFCTNRFHALCTSFHIAKPMFSCYYTDTKR